MQVGKTATFAQISIEGSVLVECTRIAGDWSNVVIRPLALGLVGTITGSKLEIVLPSPEPYACVRACVRVNHTHHPWSAASSLRLN